MSIGTLTSEDQSKLKHVVAEGVRTSQEIEDLKGALSDTVKAVAEELQIKPAILNRAIRAAFKDTLDADKETVDDVEEILTLIGRRSF